MGQIILIFRWWDKDELEKLARNIEKESYIGFSWMEVWKGAIVCLNCNRGKWRAEQGEKEREERGHWKTGGRIGKKSEDGLLPYLNIAKKVDLKSFYHKQVSYVRWCLLTRLSVVKSQYIQRLKIRITYLKLI